MANDDSRCVLVIEDDADTQANVCDILELDGYAAVTAATFAEALDRSGWASIAAILMDRRLPDGNAEAMLPRFRSVAPKIPIVVITGFPDVEGAIGALREGAYDYLLKPINPDALRASLRRIAEQQRSENALREADERLRQLQAEVLRVAEEEQRRIGQELHDSVQQELTGLGLLAQNVFETLVAGSVPDVKQAERVAKGIAQTNRNVRLLSRGLIPVDVDAQGLMAALAELANRTVQLCGLQSHFECAEPVELADGLTATQLYRIAQEAVNNVVKHAKASELRIQLSQQADRLVLRVVDNGIGISAQRAKREGTGLHIMAYRAGLIGGDVDVAASSPSGTAVTCTIMLTRESD